MKHTVLYGGIRFKIKSVAMEKQKLWAGLLVLLIISTIVNARPQTLELEEREADPGWVVSTIFINIKLFNSLTILQNVLMFTDNKNKYCVF